MTAEEENAFNSFGGGFGGVRNLADIIMQKLEEHTAGQDASSQTQGSGMDARTIELYGGVKKGACPSYSCRMYFDPL